MKRVLFTTLLVFVVLLCNGQKAQQKAPKGAINGKFSVSADKQVYFSKGNLQYQPSTKKWRFAAHQYDVIEEDNAKAHSTPNFKGWIDIFYWGYGSNLIEWECDDNHIFVDWGSNTISNGGSNDWRTLTADEWRYVLFNRKTSSGIRFLLCIVNGVYGMIVFPDDWKLSDYHLNLNINDVNNSISYNKNKLSKEDFAKIEARGAVFLPCKYGYVYNGMWVSWNVKHIYNGEYWTSSRATRWPYWGIMLNFQGGEEDLMQYYFADYHNCLSEGNVRLVCPVK